MRNYKELANYLLECKINDTVNLGNMKVFNTKRLNTDKLLLLGIVFFNERSYWTAIHNDGRIEIEW